MSLSIRGQSSLELTVTRIRMYNRRIKDWKIMKNYKRKEKDAVCCALQKRTQAGKISHHVTIRDQPVKFQRILRHMKDFANGTGMQDSGGLQLPQMTMELKFVPPTSNVSLTMSPVSQGSKLTHLDDQAGTPSRAGRYSLAMTKESRRFYAGKVSVISRKSFHVMHIHHKDQWT